MNETRTPEHIGKRLRDMRKVNDMSQQEVADALGMTRSAISKIEHGCQEVLLSHIVKLARLYGRTPSAIAVEILGNAS